MTVIVTGRVDLTVFVVMLKAGELAAPAAIATEAGTTATDGSELASVTTMPPDGAGPSRFTLFAVVVFPPATDVGERVTDCSDTGFTVRLTVLLTPL